MIEKYLNNQDYLKIKKISNAEFINLRAIFPMILAKSTE